MSIPLAGRNQTSEIPNESRRYSARVLRCRLALAGNGNALQLEHDAGGSALSDHAIDLVRAGAGALRGRDGHRLSLVENVGVAALWHFTRDAWVFVGV